MNTTLTHRVVQFFCQDENDVDAYLDHLRGYVKPHAQRTAFTEARLGEMERHLRGIARPEGLFTDTLVTGQPGVVSSDGPGWWYTAVSGKTAMTRCRRWRC